ncbi:phosphomannomutase [Vairimorpha necatrix]|uniref:Phosphomannomutase n=1 Tax=Vairimorpha necatrix TaxID=6039 RepID=A0AAX4JEV0_9MICR
MSEYTKDNTIFLFDVDGTLTPSRCPATQDILNLLKNLRKKVKIGFVGGSNIEKQIEQVGDNCLSLFDYAFPENGLSFYKNGKLVEQERIIDFMKEDLYKKFVNFCLSYLSKIDIPIKRGTFIEYRDSMINISPIGRNCSSEERLDFYNFDKKEKIREKMVEALRNEFDKDDMDFVIGGQISIDCFPKGWDKRYCLKHIKNEGIRNVIFFGDMTQPGGNDYEIFRHPEVKGIRVSGPEDTIKKVDEELRKINL